MEEQKDQPKQEENIVEQASKAANAIKLENDRREILLKREEELAARRMLGGKTDNVDKQPEKVVESNLDFAKRFMQGKALGEVVV